MHMIKIFYIIIRQFHLIIYENPTNSYLDDSFEYVILKPHKHNLQSDSFIIFHKIPFNTMESYVHAHFIISPYVIYHMLQNIIICIIDCYEQNIKKK